MYLSAAIVAGDEKNFSLTGLCSLTTGLITRKFIKY